MKVLARHLLLVALLLQAFVPAGWMPNVAHLGQGAFIICTADGHIRHGTPDQDHQHPQPCAFAAAHVMAGPAAHAVAAPLLQVAAIQILAAPRAISIAAAFTPQAPRAPPVFA